jgi:tetratricopeptide (TPR) repeat protein
LTDCGFLELKGLPDPVSVCEVAWEPLPVSSVPLPALPTEVGRIFVGREEELGRLKRSWKEAADGALRVVLLAGEPGVGKTRLAAELAGAVHTAGATVLAGRCDEDMGVPYQPFVEALRQFADHTQVEELRSGIGRYGSELARLVPELADRLSGLAPPLRSDPETERYRLFDAVAAWLAAASTEQPVLVVLDDLQWAARPTLLLLRHVIRSSEPMRALIVGTYRDTELGHDHPLPQVLGELRRQAGTERLSLSGLDEAAVAAFIEQAAHRDLGGEHMALVRAVHTETEGNPFFVREVLRHLAETGALERQDAGWVQSLPIEELGIPEGVREVVGRRLLRLSSEANRALRSAAVVGTEFEYSVVKEVGGLREDALLGALEEAVQAHLLVEVPGPAARYRFAHALVRDTLYEELSGARRRLLHRHVAEAIESLYAGHLDDHLPALSHHFARALAPAAESARVAAAYARRAGERALAQLANDEAAGYYRQALELLDTSDVSRNDGERVDLLIALGEAQRRAGDPAFRQTLLDAAVLARERGDRDALVRAALANNRGQMWSSTAVVDQERVAVLEAALAVTDDSDPATRARLLANLGVELIFSAGRDRAALSDDALALARRHGDAATVGHVLRARYFTIATLETRDQRWKDTAELITLAESVGDPALRCQAYFLRVRSAMERGDIEEFDRCLAIADQLAVELGQPTLRWTIMWPRVGRVLLAGRIGEAETLSLKSLELGQAAGEPDAMLMFLPQRFQIRLEQGRLGEMEPAVGDVIQRMPGVRIAEAMLALIYSEMDREDEARAALRPFTDSGFQGLAADIMRVRVLTSLATVAAQLGDRTSARLLHDLLVPYADHIDTLAGTVNGSIGHYLGLLACTLRDFDEADRRFAAAAAVHSRICAPCLLARTRLEWARMLLARRDPGDGERASELLGQALATARELGLATVERRAVALLA